LVKDIHEEYDMNVSEFLKYFSRVLTLLIVIPVHEAAHGLMAKKMGDDTAEKKGRISLNPFVHLDFWGSVLMIFTGFGWAKPVPVNPVRMKNPRAGLALTAFAGPVSNLIAAFLSGLAYNLMLCSETCLEAYFSGNITSVVCVMIIFEFLFTINVGLAVFNLLPMPPLDGFNILSFFLNDKALRWVYTHQREMSVCFMGLIVLLNIIPAEYNILNIAAEDIANLLWKAVSWIPRLKWGMY